MEIPLERFIKRPLVNVLFNFLKNCTIPDGHELADKLQQLKDYIRSSKVAPTEQLHLNLHDKTGAHLNFSVNDFFVILAFREIPCASC